MRLGFFISCVLWTLIAFGIYAAVAGAQVIEGTSSGDVLNGTANADRIYGYGGADTINAKGAGDYAEGGSGADTLDMGCGYDDAIANGDDDLIYVDCADGKSDGVDCGSGYDIVFWRVPGTTIAANCEQVYLVTGSGA